MKIKRIISTVLSTVLLIGVILADTAITDRTTYQLTAHAKETVETIATTYQTYIYDSETLVITYLPEVHNFSGVHFAVEASDTSLGKICLIR
ncbi:hypothetical protein [Ruminococcus flavefaciens]|uniref:hypothetical protein n=1 Tax=Ruminococcus flavefaciens TaxID=1265 RepID=UPI00048D27DA|nr:hypothetical protein [Ruminococcus flavefaciens]